MAEQKHRLRKVMRNCRAALPPEQARALSDRIQTRALELDCYRNAAAVLLYAAVDNEVATDLIHDDALATGRPVFYPVANPGSAGLIFNSVRALEDLRRGHFGIPEPRIGERLDASRIARAVVFVPGLAFSATGHRLGRGGGFYDRFLASAEPGVTTVGLGYSFQFLEWLPKELWDRRLDYVLTEHAIHDARDSRHRRGMFDEKGGVPKCIY
jgi:5-formyltetrahydrofolate cyclo-ligase